MSLRTTGRLAVIALLAVAAAACSDKAKVREPAKLKDIDKPTVRLDQRWSQSVGEGADGRPSGLKLALEDDALFVAERGGEVVALDPATGRERWKTKLKATIGSGPTVAGDLILIGTLEADVIALKRADGSTVWRAPVSSEVLAAPAASGDVVVARSVDGRVFGLSATDGHRLWTFDRTVPTLTLRGLSAPLIEGSRVLIGMDSGRLVAVQLKDGTPVWEHPVSVPSGRTELERLADIDAPLVETLGGVLVASYGGDVALVDGADGESRWRRAIKSGTGLSPGGPNVFVSDADGIVWALDAESGAAVWKNDALQYRRLSAPVFYKGMAVVADYEGYVHFLDAGDGHFVGRTRVGRKPILAPMVATDTTLYVMNVDGKLAALTTR